MVFSHLRWDFVYQRPQQVLSRLARQRPVLYIEEPLPGPKGWTTSHPAPGVTVAKPTVGNVSSMEETDRVMSELTRDLVSAEGLERAVAWVYTPMAEPLLDGVDPALVVYDCMDELSLFLGAPPELVRMEAALLERADLVFTGGVSLYRGKASAPPPCLVLSQQRGRPPFRAGRDPATAHRSSRRTRLRCPCPASDTSASSTSGWTWLPWTMVATSAPRVADRRWSGPRSRSTRPPCRSAAEHPLPGPAPL